MNQFVLFAALGDIGNISLKRRSNTAERFGVDWPHFIAQVISFLIVAILLYKFAYKPILQVLEERRQRIAEGLANAEKIKRNWPARKRRARKSSTRPTSRRTS